MDSVRLFFENQKREGSGCEKVLGNSAAVHAFAKFYAKHQEDLGVQSAGALIEYLTDGSSRSSEETKAFQAGLASLPMFFEACFREIEAKKSPPAKESP